MPSSSGRRPCATLLICICLVSAVQSGLALPGLSSSCLRVGGAVGQPTTGGSQQTYEMWEGKASVLRFEGNSCFFQNPRPDALRLRGGAPFSLPPLLMSEKQLIKSTLAVGGAQGFAMLVFPSLMINMHQANMAFGETGKERHLISAQYSLAGANYFAFGVFVYLLKVNIPIVRAVVGYAITTALCHIYVSYNGLSSSRTGLFVISLLQLLFAGALFGLPEHSGKILTAYAVATLLAGAQAIILPAFAARTWTKREDDQSPVLGDKSLWLIRFATMPSVGLSLLLLMGDRFSLGERLTPFWFAFTLFWVVAVYNKDWAMWENANGFMPIVWGLMGSYFTTCGIYAST
eukprot:CAMPEP_0172012640 /NCGR_PEP_ID=MMETSP1041-20130122/8953_1 /TAXON_ID=464988 /ORGANISM="Hemiselmis andersenii, Strain CCMP439" /LENGTH=346 /DNA_ID=CAMNT_0012667245 /DNA_START=6 /DNA_END=1046 /DNA_ORIENTATION=-